MPTPAQLILLAQQELTATPRRVIASDNAEVTAGLLAVGYRVMMLSAAQFGVQYLIFSDLPGFLAEIIDLNSPELIPQLSAAYTVSNVAWVDTASQQLLWRARQFQHLPSLAELRAN